MSEQDHEEPVEGEVVEGELVPVAVDVQELTTGHWSANPTVQAAAAAATGFVAGAATLALMRRYGLRRVAQQVQSAGGALDANRRRPRWPMVPDPGETYLVHVRVVTPRPYE